jgi:hypothetical protein
LYGLNCREIAFGDAASVIFCVDLGRSSRRPVSVDIRRPNKNCEHGNKYGKKRPFHDIFILPQFLDWF